MPQPGWWRRGVRAWRDLGPVGLLLALASFGPALGTILILGTLRQLGPWLHGHVSAGLPLFVALAALLTGLALVPLYIQSPLAGWAFGTGLGFAAVLAAQVGGAALTAAITRCVSGDKVVRLIDAKPRWQAVRRALLAAGFRRSLLIVTLVRLPPNCPFALTSVVMASIRVPWPAYVIGTALGLAPHALVEVYIGAQLRHLHDLHLSGHYLIAHLLVSVALSLLALLVIGLIARRALRRVTEP